MKITLTLCIALLVAAAVQAEQAPVGLIEDGVFMDGATGLLKKEPVLDVWSFLPDEDIVASQRRIAAGSSIQMLPSSVLEQMTGLTDADAEQPQMRVRLWAIVTQYKHFNYLYSVYFLPVQEEGQPAVTPAQADDATEPAEEESIIPGDLLAQIRAYQTPDLAKLEKVAEVTGDINLIGRVGFLHQRGRAQVFRPDAFGQKIDSREYTLLPGIMLTRAEREMNKTPGRQRFKVSGLVTTYKGQTYMLIRSASPTYTHGNFTY